MHMSRVSTFVAGLSSWQVFLLIGVPFFAAAYLATPGPGQRGGVLEMEATFSRMTLALMPAAIALYAWIWSIGDASNRAASERARRPDRFFNFALPYAFAYLIFAYFFFPSPGKMDDPVVPIGLVMILHVFAVACTFYAIASAAMRLRSFETGDRAGFRNALGTFFMIWFFPLGVWFVQRRVNRAADVLVADA